MTNRMNIGIFGSNNDSTVDGVHLTADGRAVFTTAIARSLEFADDRNSGQCLRSVFDDDSKVLDAMPTTIPDETVTTDVSEGVVATTVVP